MKSELIDYQDIFIYCGIDDRRRFGNNICPFCGTFSFKVYYDSDNVRAKCHNKGCQFSGNPIKFYAKLNGLEYEDAQNELFEAFKLKKIKLKKKTKKEAKTKLRQDLYFLSLVRMYFAFYGNNRQNKSYYQARSGIAQSTFSRIINGDIESTSRNEWNECINYLKSVMDIDSFIKDIKLKDKYFMDDINSLSDSNINKFQ